MLLPESEKIEKMDVNIKKKWQHVDRGTELWSEVCIVVYRMKKIDFLAIFPETN